MEEIMNNTENIKDMEDMEYIEDMDYIEDEEEMEEEFVELVKPPKMVIFKKNTQEQLGVVVNLTKEKEYEVLSVKIPAQYDVKPSVNNVVLYLIEDDNGERNYYFSNYFKNK